MSREILFRSKAINRDKYISRSHYKNGDWVYGLVTRLYDARFPSLPAEMTDINGISLIEVDDKTISQYTGMNDINGNKIFEGDIVHCKSRIDRANMFVTFEDGKFLMVLCEEFTTHKRGLGHYEIECFDKEVIGNIYDNPELIDKAIAKSKLRNYEILA